MFLCVCIVYVWNQDLDRTYKMDKLLQYRFNGRGSCCRYLGLVAKAFVHYNPFSISKQSKCIHMERIVWLQNIPFIHNWTSQKLPLTKSFRSKFYFQSLRSKRSIQIYGYAMSINLCSKYCAEFLIFFIFFIFLFPQRKCSNWI